MTSIGVGDAVEGRRSKNNNGEKQPDNTTPKHETTSDSETPETGVDEGDQSTSESHEKEILIPLKSGDGEADYSTAAPARTAAHLSAPQSEAAAPRPPNGGTAVLSSSRNSSGSSSVQSTYEFQYESSELQAAPQNPAPSHSVARSRSMSEHSEMMDSETNYSALSETFTWKFRMLCGKLVNNEYVQVGIIVLIVVNALMMGVATFDFVMDDPDVDQAFARIDRGFLVIFTIECVMQLIYLGLTLFADGWLVFDLLIVVFSWSFESLQIVRAFRIFRAFRLITRVKPLRDLVLAIGAVMPRMYAIAALLLLIFYIFSVLFTELFSMLPLSDKYFTTLGRSLFTCMEMMTLEWGEIAREVMTHEPWAWAPFSAFIMITGFIVFNLIVAVVCDAVAVTEKNVRELDGFEPDNPEHKLLEAQERIDLLQCHINDMLRTQEQVQQLIESMAAELLHLEAERMKAEHREAELRIEMDRRMAYQEEMDTSSNLESFERTYLQEKEKKEEQRRQRELMRKASMVEEEESSHEKQSRMLGLALPDKSKIKRAASNHILKTKGGGILNQISFKNRSNHSRGDNPHSRESSARSLGNGSSTRSMGSTETPTTPHPEPPKKTLRRRLSLSPKR